MITLLLVTVLLAAHTLLIYHGGFNQNSAENTLTQKWRVLHRAFKDRLFDDNNKFYCCNSRAVPLAVYHKLSTPRM